jgi:hypothetical protein
MKYSLFKVFFISIFSVITILLSLSSCKKETSTDKRNQKISQELISDINDWLKNISTVSGDSAQLNIASIVNSLDFESADMISIREDVMIVIPLNKGFLTKTKQLDTEKCFVIMQNKDSKLSRANVIEISNVGSKSLSRSKLIRDIYLGKVPDFDCNFFIYSLGGRIAYKLQYLNSDLYSYSFPTQVVSASNYSQSYSTLSCTIIDWFLVTYINGVEVGRVYLYSSTYGDCGSGCEPTMIQCGSGGGSGGSELTLPVHIDSVKKEITDPCLTGVLDQITDPKLKSEVAKLFQETYVGWGGQVNIKFIQDNTLIDSDGYPQFAGSFLTGNTWNIKLNSTFVSSASKEFMGLNVLHEIVHSFIELYQNNTNAPLSEFQHHKLFFEKWINQIRDAMVEIYGISSSDATALALQGLDDVLTVEIGPNQFAFREDYNNFAIQKYGTDLFSAKNIFTQYEEGTKGVKCQ